MKESGVFRPRLSGWIMGMYWAILVFLAALLIGVPIAEGMDFISYAAFTSLFSVILVVFILIMLRAYRMSFVVADRRVIINGIFRKNVIEISDIKTIQKSPIPYGFRLYGASFLGGWYFLPGIGKAWISMGNFSDGVLITTKQNRHYVITPRNPPEFIKAVKGIHRPTAPASS